MKIELNDLCHEFNHRAGEALRRCDPGAVQAWMSAAQMIKYLLDDNQGCLAAYMTAPERDAVDDEIFAYANRFGTCPYWEVDDGAVVEAKSLLGYDYPHADEECPGDTREPTDLDRCGPYCRHVQYVDGYPGEHGYACTHPSCHRILEMWFNRSEVE